MNTRGNIWPTRAGWSIRAVGAITVIEAAIARYGAPQHLPQ